MVLQISNPGHLLDDRLGAETMDDLRGKASEVILELLAQVRRLDAGLVKWKSYTHLKFNSEFTAEKLYTWKLQKERIRIVLQASFFQGAMSTLNFGSIEIK